MKVDRWNNRNTLGSTDETIVKVCSIIKAHSIPIMPDYEKHMYVRPNTWINYHCTGEHHFHYILPWIRDWQPILVRSSFLLYGDGIMILTYCTLIWECLSGCGFQRYQTVQPGVKWYWVRVYCHFNSAPQNRFAG